MPEKLVDKLRRITSEAKAEKERRERDEEEKDWEKKEKAFKGMIEELQVNLMEKLEDAARSNRFNLVFPLFKGTVQELRDNYYARLRNSDILNPLKSFCEENGLGFTTLSDKDSFEGCVRYYLISVSFSWFPAHNKTSRS